MAVAVHGSKALEDLLHENETRMCRNFAYAGQKKELRQHAPKAKYFPQKTGSRHHALSGEERARNHTKSKVRSRVEHVFKS